MKLVELRDLRSSHITAKFQLPPTVVCTVPRWPRQAHRAVRAERYVTDHLWTSVVCRLDPGSSLW